MKGFLGMVKLIFYLVLTFKAFHSAGGINYLLLTGEEGMALAAQLYSKCLFGGAGGEGIAAGADYLGVGVVLGMYLRSHFVFSL